MAKPPSDIKRTQRLMAALGRMPPKPHAEMKLGKSRVKAGASPTKRSKPPRLKQPEDQDVRDVAEGLGPVAADIEAVQVQATKKRAPRRSPRSK